MRRWWRTLGRGEQIAFASLVVTLFVGLLSAAPAYFLFLREPTNGSRNSVTTTSEAGPTTTAVDQFRKALKGELLATVPEGVRETCFEAEDRRVLRHAEVSVGCASDGVAVLRLARYRDLGTLLDDYNRAAERVGVKRDSGALNCRANRPGEGAWTEDNTDAGRYLCYLDANRHAWLHWTYAKHHLYGFAYRKDANIKALDKWWDDYYASSP